MLAVFRRVAGMLAVGESEAEDADVVVLAHVNLQVVVSVGLRAAPCAVEEGAGISVEEVCDGALARFLRVRTQVVRCRSVCGLQRHPFRIQSAVVFQCPRRHLCQQGFGVGDEFLQPVPQGSFAPLAIASASASYAVCSKAVSAAFSSAVPSVSVRFAWSRASAAVAIDGYLPQFVVCCVFSLRVGAYSAAGKVFIHIPSVQCTFQTVYSGCQFRLGRHRRQQAED